MRSLTYNSCLAIFSLWILLGCAASQHYSTHEHSINIDSEGAHLNQEDNREPTRRIFIIGTYEFEIPQWWDSIDVEVPPHLENENCIRRFVHNRYGADTGTEETWQQALKVWVLAYSQTDLFPVYLGHSYRVGHRYREAARVYIALYERAHTQGKLSHWYSCYLAHNAALVFELLGEMDKASQWHEQAARYREHDDGVIRYYAGRSIRALRSLSSH